MGRQKPHVALTRSRHGHDDVFRLLLDHGDIDLGLADISGMLPLMHASRKGHAKIVRLLLLYWPSSIDVKDNFGKTSLMVAARHGHLDVVQVLLEFDADVSLKDHFYKTALDCARERKHPGIETLLLQASAEATRSERSGASSVTRKRGKQATKVKITSQILRLSVFVTCCLLFIVSCVWRLPRLDRRNA
jgi:serine/threonine-protein phosphatase 6 regulatory ankyrin repeat subunit B